jgi:hypothetical protein
VVRQGPYSEHFVRDVGGLYLALLVVTLAALVRPDAMRLRLAGLAWSAFAVPHALFHIRHLAEE